MGVKGEEKIEGESGNGGVGEESGYGAEGGC